MSGRSSIGLRSGLVLTIRAVDQRDAAGLQDYIRKLSVSSRYSRMLGAVSEWPPSDLQMMLHPTDADHVALIATLMIDGGERIVGEARLVHDRDIERVELALSVDDRWHRQGLGAALFGDLQRRAARIGDVDLVGETLRTNEAMLRLARRAGFAMTATPDDWRLVRFGKHLAYRGGMPEAAAAQLDITAR